MYVMLSEAKNLNRSDAEILRFTQDDTERERQMGSSVKSAAQGATLPRILVVDDEPAIAGLLNDVVGRAIPCSVLEASNLCEAKRILATQGVELMVADVNLPDGKGTELLGTLRDMQPAASAIVMTGKPSMERAIEAIRGGAIDFLPKPFSSAQLLERVKGALKCQAGIAQRERRLIKLRDAVKRLNEARRVVSRKVDLLCNDLITAYGELSRQLDVVRTQESFRKLMAQAKDLEQLLCHAMDWILRQLGYCNVAIWLAGEDGSYQLGAYMKYTIPGEPPLTDAMRQGLVPLVNRDAFIHLGSDEAGTKLSAAELQHLAGQTILGVSCTYLGEALASVLVFRDGKTPFTQDDTQALKLISPIFATSLASSVHAAEESDGSEGGLLDDDGPKGPKKNDADWWKRGEEPPF
jgi:DNA-binding response OmpR family regulator